MKTGHRQKGEAAVSVIIGTPKQLFSKNKFQIFRSLQSGCSEDIYFRVLNYSEIKL